ncbi:MAG: hypothetical protein AB1566_07280, partial [Chloroflexota bacterium]
LGLSFLVASLLMAPLYWPLVQQVFSRGGGYLGEYGTVRFSADLLAFFLPSPYNPFYMRQRSLQDLGARALGVVNGWDNVVSVFLGIVPLLTAGLALTTRRRRLGFWLTLGMTSAVLALGPLLKIGGSLAEVVIEERRSFVVLPYALLKEVPLIGLNRTPGRFGGLVTLALAVLVSYGAGRLLVKLTTRSTRLTIVGLLATFIILEQLWIFPFPVVDASIPLFYTQLAAEPMNYVVLELPLTAPYLSARPMLYQTRHQHRMVGGYLPRVPQPAREKAEAVAALALPGDIVVNEKAGPLELAPLGIRYVVVQKELMNRAGPTTAETAAKYLGKHLGEPNYEDTKILAFRVPQKVPLEKDEQMLYQLRNGWYPVEYWNGEPTRWTEGMGVLQIRAAEQIPEAQLTLNALSFKQLRRFKVLANDRIVGNFIAQNEGFQHYVTDDFALRRGDNTIVIQAVEACRIPLEFGENDGRCLALAIQSIRLLAGE